MQLRTKVTNGKLSEEFIRQLQKAAGSRSDGHLLVTLYRVPPVPKLEHYRRYYWSLCRAIHDFLVHECGYDKISLDDIHLRNKKLYMNETFMDFSTLQTYKQEKSSTQLEAHEWNRILDQIKQEWAQRGLYLPDRNQPQTT